MAPYAPYRPHATPVANRHGTRKRQPSPEHFEDLHAWVATLYARTFLVFLPVPYGNRANKALAATTALGSAPAFLDDVFRPEARDWTQFVRRLSFEYALISLVALATLM